MVNRIAESITQQRQLRISVWLWNVKWTGHLYNELHLKSMLTKRMSRRSVQSLLSNSVAYRRLSGDNGERSCKKHSIRLNRQIALEVSRREKLDALRARLKVRDDNPMPSTAGEYWRTVLNDIESPTALIMRDQLDLSDVTGMPKRMAKSPPCFDFYAEIKRLYPDKLVVVQVGDFYEAAGIDAVLLVNEAGLAPMSIDSGMPRAGFPVRGLQKILKIMVQQQHLSMVVCKQYDTIDENGARHRAISAIYNPGDQSYDDDAFDEVKQSVLTSAIVCISREENGFCLAEFKIDNSVVHVFREMTEDALWGRLASSSIAAPVCVHTSFSDHIADWQSRIHRVASHVADRIWKMDDEDALDGFREFLRHHYALQPSQTINVEVATDDGTRRRPSFYTASQLGMTSMSGIPNIVDVIVPPDALVPVREWFRQLLSEPRSMQTSRNIQNALKRISTIPESLPQLRTYLSPGTVTKVQSCTHLVGHKINCTQTLADQNASVGFLRKLHELLTDVVCMFEFESMRELSKIVLCIVEEERSTSIDPTDFASTCMEMREAIEKVVVLDPGQDLAVPMTENQDDANNAETMLNKLFDNVERFHGVVQTLHISDELLKLNELRAAVVDVVFDTTNKLESLSSEKKNVISLQLEHQVGAVFLQIPASLLRHPDIESIGLIRPKWSIERKDKARRQFYSSVSLEEAILRYKTHCTLVEQCVVELLSEVKDRLDCETLINACRFSITAQSLIQHAWEANARNWTLPKLTTSRPFSITRMWPYWMDSTHEKTVTNNLRLEDMVLLTGPNMAGKSTVLRSVAAVAMLALAGLYTPAEKVSCPFMDHIVLRSFSGDNPFNQHSSFSMEMVEMRQAIDQCTEKSLILIDELGKGTEVKTGGGLSAGFLEYFAQTGSIGIFSTHLHLMKKMPLNMEWISLMKMNTYVVEHDELITPETPLLQKHVPSWTVAPGYNLKSLGIQVAWECGLPSEVISTACAYEAELFNQRTSRQRRSGLRSKSSQNCSSSKEKLLDEAECTKKVLPVVDSLINGAVIHHSPDAISDLLVRFCTAKGITASDGSTVQVYRVKARQHPPPFTAQKSCLYIYRRTCGHFYVGETDNLKNRLISHQRKKLKPGLDRNFETWYVCIPRLHGAKSMSRAIEKELTICLRDEGYLLESEHDASNRSFGIRD